MATKSKGKSKMEKPQNPWIAFLSPMNGRYMGPYETINRETNPQNTCLFQDIADLLELEAKTKEEKTQRGELEDGPSDIKADVKPSLSHENVQASSSSSSKQTSTIILDRSKPVSEWTCEMSMECVDFKYVKELNLPTKLVQPNPDVSDMNDLYADILDMFGVESLEKLNNRQSEIRLFIDVIVILLYKRHSLRIMMEKFERSEDLPDGRFDYLIWTKEGKPIGCIEAKSTEEFDKNAFGQAVMKIILLQQLAKKNGLNVEKTPVFCVLSDAYRYLLIMLKGSELQLEHRQDDRATKGKKPAKVINIRTLDSSENQIENYKHLVSAMSRMITMSTNDVRPVKTEAKEEP